MDMVAEQDQQKCKDPFPCSSNSAGFLLFITERFQQRKGF